MNLHKNIKNEMPDSFEDVGEIPRLFLYFYCNKEQRFDARGHTLGLVKC